jgi:hypothetical protein
MGEKRIKRRLLSAIKTHLREKEMSLIVGPRQAGKTTLMEELRDELVASEEKTLFLSMDIEEHQEFFVSQRSLFDRMKIEFGDSRGFVFLDEIQRKDDAGIFLKGLYDRHLPYKLIVSGSGSVELKEKVHESLLGRKALFELGTVSFDEWANFVTEYRYENRLPEFFSVDTDQAERLFETYMRFGGYPRILFEETLEGKQRVMNDIYRSYVEKDIAFLLHVERTDAFRLLLKVLSTQIGRLLNAAELSRTLGISLPTVQKYLWYAEKTYVIDRLTPYFRNIRKEITKSPVFYFYDLGLRGFTKGAFGMDEALPEIGFLFQNFVYRKLKEIANATFAELHFWRTKDRAEVDFVLVRGDRAIPIEVKYSILKTPRIERSFRSFLDTYRPEKAFVVNRSLTASVRNGSTEILFVPFWDLRPIESAFDGHSRGATPETIEQGTL